MNKYKKAYKQKCKRRYVEFYLKEKYLYDFSKQINFNKEIKQYLERRYREWVEN